MESKSLPFARARALPNPNKYVSLLLNDYAKWAIDEDRAPAFRGKWREEFAKKVSLDLEIGTGNGTHFFNRAQTCPERALVGIEIKFKPLIQSIRRVINSGLENARIVRYDAGLLPDLFAPGELDDVFIFFPDPWPKKKQWKNRLIQEDFLKALHSLQKPGGQVFFKTDSRDYFDWALERAQSSSYQVSQVTFDLHKSEWQAQNFVTQFENIFLRQGLPIHAFKLTKINGS